MRNEKHARCSPNAIHYIVKYNFKSEPNLRIQTAPQNGEYQTAFHARIVSVEEAATKFLGIKYFGSDIPSIYVSIKSPETRQAAYLDGQQIQITWVEKYFRRPSELEKMGILTFFHITI